MPSYELLPTVREGVSGPEPKQGKVKIQVGKWLPKMIKSHFENNLAVLQKVKYRITILHSNSSPRYTAKRNENICPHKNMYMNFHTKEVERLQCLPTDKRINKMWHIHAMDNYSDIKKMVVLIYATTWMNLENIMLSDRSQSQNITYSMIPLIRNIQNIQNNKSTEKESRLVAQDWSGNNDWDKWEVPLMDLEISFGVMKMF